MDDKGTLIDICGVNDVSSDVPFKSTVGDIDVAVFQLGESYYVIADLCTHGPGSLSEGWVEGDEVECPFHQGKFCIITGEPTGAPCTIPLRTWPVVVRDARICVSGS